MIKLNGQRISPLYIPRWGSRWRRSIEKIKCIFVDAFYFDGPDLRNVTHYNRYKTDQSRITINYKLQTKNMAYSEKVIDHYQNPKNVGTLDKSQKNVGTGLVGAPECGDVMRLQIQVDEATGMITDAKFKTFGCGSAIASSSLATEWLKGKSVDDALKIDNMDIVEELNLPPVKIHCSVLAEDAIKSAINDYREKNGMEKIKFQESVVH